MRREFTVPLRGGGSLKLGRRTVVVGVVNVTPDSFSDGGRHFDTERAIDHAITMAAEGAGVIEVGGESTRPGAAPVSVEEERQRVLPVVRELALRVQVPIAVDTCKSEVAEASLELGASIVNDVSALRFDPRVADVAARAGAVLVLMHMRGDPSTMQKIQPSQDIFAEIKTDLSDAVRKAVNAGVRRECIVLDPGIGFGKTLEQNLEIINRLDWLEALGFPLMIGTSRKSFIGRLTGRAADERVFGTAASVCASILRGAHFVRVHDVREMVEVALVSDSVLTGPSVI
jgi:dihydropteroate synthase